MNFSKNTFDFIGDLERIKIHYDDNNEATCAHVVIKTYGYYGQKDKDGKAVATYDYPNCTIFKNKVQKLIELNATVGDRFIASGRVQTKLRTHEDGKISNEATFNTIHFAKLLRSEAELKKIEANKSKAKKSKKASQSKAA